MAYQQATADPPAGYGAAGYPPADLAGHPAPRPAGATAPGAGRPRRLRPDGLIGGLHLAQLVGWQVAGIALVVAAVRGPVAALATAVPVTVLVLLTAVRVRGRWLYRWLGDRLRFRVRPRELPAGHPDPVTGLLRLLCTGSVVDPLRVDDAEVGVISYDRGVTALVELDPPDSGLFAADLRPLPPVESLLPAVDPNALPVSLQLLVETVPGPLPGVGPGLAAVAYRELAGGQVPVGRRTWLALRVGRSPAGFDDAELRAALAATLRRLGRQLRRERLAYRMLPVQDLLAAVAQLARLDAEPPPYGAGQPSVNAAPGAPRALALETWRAWWLAGRPHSCHHLTGWPTAPVPLDVLLSELPAVSVLSVAVTRPQPAGPSSGVDVELAVRLAAPDAAALARAERVLADRFRQAGGLVVRLDGQQQHGLAATLPLGGFPR